MSMILITHIIASVVGIVASYVRTITAVRSKNSADSRLKKYTRVILVATIVVVIFGSVLFAEKPAEFLASGRFLSNMTIMLVLLGIEILATKQKTAYKMLQFYFASTFTWTWIFLIASFEPSFPYLYFIIAYLLGGYAVCTMVRRVFKQKMSV